MSKLSPTVTLAVTCYNADTTIDRALTSARKVAGNVIEILVYDDCSTDGSWIIIQNHEQIDQRIRVIRSEKNVGVGAARARLVAEAKGEFLLFLDDDDVSLPHRAERQIAKILEIEAQTNNTLVVCYTSGEKRYPNGYTKTQSAIASQSDAFGGVNLAAYLLYFERKSSLHYGSGTPTCSLAARVSTLREVGSFDPNFRRLADVDFAIKLGLADGLVCGISDICFIRYVTSGADKTNKNILASKMQLADKHRSFLSAKGLYYYAKNWPRLRYYHLQKQYLPLLWTLLLLIARYPNRAIKHFLTTAPKRLKHERKIARGQ